MGTELATLVGNLASDAMRERQFQPPIHVMLLSTSGSVLVWRFSDGLSKVIVSHVEPGGFGRAIGAMVCDASGRVGHQVLTALVN